VERADRATSLDRWLDSHAEQIHDAVFNLIITQKDHLKGGFVRGTGGSQAKNA